jgi:two-component system, response regulator
MLDQTAEILLVEDSFDDAAFFTRMFNKADLPATLHVATDGREALDFVYGTGDHADRSAGSRPRVIFLDLNLPKLNGLEVLRHLKNDPGTRAIPVVVLTSSEEECDLIESYELGANSYLVKPMDFDRLGESVRKASQYWLELNQTPKF